MNPSEDDYARFFKAIFRFTKLALSFDQKQKCLQVETLQAFKQLMILI